MHKKRIQGRRNPTSWPSTPLLAVVDANGGRRAARLLRPAARALVAGIARGAARRKCAVAAARKLAVDRWRLATQQTTPEKLHLQVLAEVPA